MKKLFLLTCLTACLFSACSIFDIDEISDRVGALEDRVAELEELCNSINSDISSLNTIVKALQTNDYVTGVTPIVSNRIEIGFIISFKYADPISIYHGENGKDGEDGKDGKDGVDGKDAVAPVISIKAASDGIYYWTVDGEWLLNENGDKVKAVGTTPQLKIEEEYWYVSYDGGKTWDRLGKATGEDGSDGTDGSDGKDSDTLFKDIDTSNTDYILITLQDGVQLKIPTWHAFEALQKQCQMMNDNIESLQALVDALSQNDWITSVSPIMENGVQVGYKITFGKADPISIYHGKDGSGGSVGAVPVIGLRKYTDGYYYWTSDGNWLLDADGKMVRASGIDGDKGQTGSDGVTPKLKITDGYWYVSYNNGSSWSQLGKATGEDGADGDSMFRKVTQDDENVYFTLADGTVLTLPKQSVLSVSFAQGNTVYAAAGLTTEVDYTVTSSLSSVTVEAIGSGDIKAMALPASSGALYGKIRITVGDTIDDYSKVVVLVSNGNRVIMSTISVKPKPSGGSSNDPLDEDDEWSNLFD